MLAVSPCLDRCDWAPTKASYDGQRLFACRGCGSQWVGSEPWAPRQADGSVPAGVRQARQRAARGRG